VLCRLDGVRERQHGQWSARCPAHEDKGPSLSVRLGHNGGVLLHCFAACTAAEIVASMGLKLSDLFPPRERPVGAPMRTPSLLTDRQALELAADELMFASILLTNVFDHGVLPRSADVDRLRQCTGRVCWLRRQMTRDKS
jgi:hypothetical protein